MTDRKRIFKSGACAEDWTAETLTRVTLHDVIGSATLWDAAEPKVIRWAFGDHAFPGWKSYRIIIEANADAFKSSRRSDRVGLDEDWAETLHERAETN